MSRVYERVTLPESLTGLAFKTVKVLDSLELQKAYTAGKEAKRKGWERIAPYYNIPPLEHFWMAGYDGKTFAEAASVNV